MTSQKAKLEQLAIEWVTKGQSKEGLLPMWDLFCAKCWLYSAGAKKDGYSELIAQLIESSENALGSGWWDRFLYQKEYCSRCGMRYKLENLTICTDCQVLRCGACIYDSGRSLLPNGNKACGCGGEIVG